MIAKKLKRVVSALALLLLAFLVLFVVGVLWPLRTVTPIHTKKPLLIRNVSVIDIERGKLVPNQSILIKDDKITAVGAQGEIETSEQVEVIDGSNRFLMPALWDMHVHIYKIAPLLDLPLHIAYGVTNVRDMLGCPTEKDPFISCPKDKENWTQQAVTGQIVGPRVISSTSFMAHGPRVLKHVKNVPKFYGTSNAEEARQFVQHFAGQVKEIKVYDGIPREAYFALADEAKKLGMDVVGHRPHAVSAIEAARHQKSIEHARFILHESFAHAKTMRSFGGTPSWVEKRRQIVDQHSPKMAKAIFAAMIEHDSWYVPTHLTRQVDAYAEEDFIRKDPLLRYMHPILQFQWMEDVNKVLHNDPSPKERKAYRDFYQKGLELTKAAHDAGVKILVGTDYIVAGATVHQELQLLVKAGLEPIDALRAATINPAKYYGLTDQYGTVARGKKADLILLNKNPLVDISNSLSIESVIFNGNWYKRKDLDNISDHVQHQARSWSVACKIIWQYLKNPVNY